MELPLGGPALRHYTQSRPRPHRQKLNYRPSRPQETIIESENEVLEHMGRVDEGVEEFFTKRVLPTDTPKKQDEESITVHDVAPASSIPCPPPTKTLRRKLGDFFTLKKKRGLKSEASHEGRPKKTSIADLIRPLREVARAEKEKDKDRVKEHDKENEKEKAKEQPGGVTGEPAVQETPVPSAPPLRGEAVPPRRALREGKSQSLILLSGSAAAGTTNARNNAKKQFEGQHSFEQKLHLMLQRIGVSKPQPGETQNQEGEMKKAESEGTIIDSKPEPPPTFSKPRTMSASSDTRHQIRPSVSAHESAGKPALPPKPVLKTGPPPTTSGRNTPENEVTQIQETETNMPTKPSTTAAPSPPPPGAATIVPTISIPDSASFTVSPSSTVTPPDTEICTDSVNPAAAATTPTNVTELDSETSVPEATTSTATELPAFTCPATLTSTTTPSEPPATASVPSTSLESITLSVSVTSSSATITMPSITTSETVSAPGDESTVTTTSTNLSTESTLPEPNVVLSVDASPAAGGDAAISVITTTLSPSASTSTMPTGLFATAEFISEASDGPVTSTVTVTSVSSVTQPTSPPCSLNDTITVSPDATVATSSTLPKTTTVSSVCHPATLSPTDTSVPSTSSSETTPTDTTSTTTTSLTRADITSTTSSASKAAISSPFTTDFDPPHTDHVSTTLTTPIISRLPATDNSSAASQHLTSPAPSDDKDLKKLPEDMSSVESAEKETDDEVVKMGQTSKPTEMDETKEIVNGDKKSYDDSENATLVTSEETRKEAQEEGVKAEDETMAAPPSGKECVRCSDKGVVEGPKPEEAKSGKEK
ncbi:hypothetical protein Q5P01_006736 [Channa striata]|uniref:CARMIL C-terminal domain-containing protein n=1 Tax=Channa striata TaxID=64152 RepID=A0AA88T4P1_CHASR|nr:hypothetical protein Q5P01_006736 [Channa striata]